MKPIEKALDKITGYLISIKRDIVNGHYELEIGLPPKWVFDNGDKIECEVLQKSDAGKLIKVSPIHKDSDIEVDDLIDFVGIIIRTNERIAEKEQEFTNRMDELKGVLEKEAHKFYTELDELKETSFKKMSSELNSDETSQVEIKRRRRTKKELESSEQEDKSE